MLRGHGAGAARHPHRRVALHALPEHAHAAHDCGRQRGLRRSVGAHRRPAQARAPRRCARPGSPPPAPTSPAPPASPRQPPPSTTPWARRRSAGDAFLRARALKVDPARRVVTCQRSDVHPGEAAELEVAYDTLVVAVGGNSTMPAGAQGVAEHCLPLRSLPDAQNVHRRLLACFEMAARPGISAEERAALLSLVVVGGGPTGLEVAAQLYDQAGLGLGSFGRNRAHAVCTDSLPCFPAARRTRCARRCCRTVRRTACP